MAGAWAALLAYALNSGMVTPARLITPYYPLLLAPLLALARQAVVIRRRWWRATETLVLVVARVFWLSRRRVRSGPRRRFFPDCWRPGPARCCWSGR